MEQQGSNSKHHKEFEPLSWSKDCHCSLSQWKLEEKWLHGEKDIINRCSRDGNKEETGRGPSIKSCGKRTKKNRQRLEWIAGALKAFGHDAGDSIIAKDSGAVVAQRLACLKFLSATGRFSNDVEKALYVNLPFAVEQVLKLLSSCVLSQPDKMPRPMTLHPASRFHCPEPVNCSSAG